MKIIEKCAEPNTVSFRELKCGLIFRIPHNNTVFLKVNKGAGRYGAIEMEQSLLCTLEGETRVIPYPDAELTF